MGCGASVKIETPQAGFSACVLHRSGSIFRKHGNMNMPPTTGSIDFKLNAGDGSILATLQLVCSKTDHDRAFVFESTISAGDTKLTMQVAEPKRSQGEYPIWKLTDRTGAQPPFRVSGSFGQTGFARISTWQDPEKVLASAMFLMDSMGSYTQSVFIYRGNILDKSDAVEKSKAVGNLVAFVKDRKSDENLPYQKHVVKEGQGAVNVADELLEPAAYAELTWCVFMLLGMTLAGLDAGRRYYSDRGPGSSGDGTGPTQGDQAWGYLIHEPDVIS